MQMKTQQRVLDLCETDVLDVARRQLNRVQAICALIIESCS